MSNTIYTCTGCVPIDKSIVDTYVALLSADKSVEEAEEARVEAEAGRVTAEESRVTAEGSRDTAEAGRVLAESGRVLAENARVDAETARETQAGNDHTRAEGDHGTAVSDHAQVGEDHTASVAATTRANDAAAAAEHMVDIKTGPQGPQGNTGSSVDYPYELVNNVTTDDATKGLSAAQGVVLDGKISQLGQEVSIFKTNTPVDYSDDVIELWLSNTPTGSVCFKCYDNSAYLVCIDAEIYARTEEVPSDNNVAYPIKVYSGGTSEYPTGTILGYVMFKDVASFKAKASLLAWDNVSRSRCEKDANSPLIQLYLGNITANDTNAKNATNATNVVDSKTPHAGFVKELYMFGDGVDTTKKYRIGGVARNHQTYKYSIYIEDTNSNIVCYLNSSPSLPSNPIMIPEYGNSSIAAYAIVNWDEFEDGSNNGTSINLLPRVFEINYSPTIKAFLEISNIKDEITEIQGDVEDLQRDVTEIQNDIYDITTTDYERSDFKDGYLSTSRESIGNIVSLPSDSEPVTPESIAGHLTIPIEKGEIVTAQYKTLSNIYCRAWVILDANRKIKAWSNPSTNADPAETINYFDNPLKIVAEEDGYLILQFQQENYDDNVSLSITKTRKVIKITPHEDIEVCVPDEIVAVVGDTLQLYYHSIFRCADYRKYAVKVVCNIGAQYPRYYEITPSGSQIGSHALTFTIKDNNNNLLGTKTVNLKVVATGASPQTELNVLCLGASGTNGGQWASEFKRRLVGTGGSPAGSGKTNIVFVGRKDVTYEGKQVNLEATGGYSFPSYTSTSTARYRFNVSAENEPVISVGDVYSNNGFNYTIVEINITAGSGGYFSCEGTGTPQSSGTLTKVSGAGSETINFSSTSFSGNPFVYNGVIDMQQYADDYCNPQGDAHGRIDVIYTELLINGSTSYMENFATRMSEMQTFINQTKAVFPDCKFCIGLNWNPDERGGMGANYGADGSWSDVYGMKYSFMNLCNALQKYITDNNLSGYVFIVNWLNEFDTWNDMQQTTKKVNPRSNVTEIFGVNGVHPSVVGYNQMADTAWRLFVAKFCQSLTPN